MMTADQIRQKLDQIVEELGFKDVKMQVDVNRMWVHILISTSHFENLTVGQRENIIWKKFEEHLDDETILSITQCYLLTPEEFSAWGHRSLSVDS